MNLNIFILFFRTIYEYFKMNPTVFSFQFSMSFVGSLHVKYKILISFVMFTRNLNNVFIIVNQTVFFFNLKFIHKILDGKLIHWFRSFGFTRFNHLFWQNDVLLYLSKRVFFLFLKIIITSLYQQLALHSLVTTKWLFCSLLFFIIISPTVFLLFLGK